MKMDAVTADLWEDCVSSYLAWLRKGDDANPLDEPQGLDYPELTVAQFRSAREEAQRMYGSQEEEVDGT